MLRNRPEAVVRLYGEIEAFARSLGSIEIVTRERYVLLRSVRIFTDLVIMANAIRIAIHLSRRLDDPTFSKIVADAKHVTHVAKLETDEDWAAVKGYVKEAHETSLR